MEEREMLSGYTNSLMALRVRGFWEELLPGIPKFEEVRRQVCACLNLDQKTMIDFYFEEPLFQVLPPLSNKVILERISSKDLSVRAASFIASASSTSAQWHWSIVEGAVTPQQAYSHRTLREFHFPNSSLQALGFEAMDLRNYLLLWMTHCLRRRTMDAQRYTVLDGEGVKEGRMLTAMSQVKDRVPVLSLRTISAARAFPEALHRLQLTGVLE